MTEKELRQKVVDTAVSYLGCKEANGSHRKIIDLYNSHKPLARGYAVKYTDAWCSTFASAVAIACGLTDIIPTECGCERHIDLFKKLGSWVENDAYVPSPGDYIFYDWQDGSNYATTNNTGSADHVGIVVSCDGKTIKVIEGNMSDAVGYRKLAVNGRYIRGFGVPKYASKATSAPSGGGEASTPGKDEKPTPGLAVGSVVAFTGTKHYISSMAVNGKSCKPGEAKVTAVAKSGKHPYHLIKTTGSSSTVYGWVDAADVKEVAPAIVAVGSVVAFTGTKHYISSMAVNGKSCKPGEAKVTAVAKSGKHPYHLIKTTGSSSTVYGWVDAADVKEVAPAIVKGSRVKVAKGAKTYNGGSLASYVYTTTYTVIQIDGSRVVIGINGVVTAAVNIKDLTLVG